MTKELFNDIYDNEISPFIDEVCNNNSLIAVKDPHKCKAEIYEVYVALNRQYKTQIFSDTGNRLLDRHKVASCICGAFLKISVFDKTELIREIKTNKRRIEAVFYYVNEFVAFFAGCKYLSFFMAYDKKDDIRVLQDILENFPIMPEVGLIKTGLWNCVLFNLSQVKDEKQIGIEHYDIYAYAMFFFNLERFFYMDRASHK